MPSLSDRLRELGVQVGTASIRPPSRPAGAKRLLDALDGAWETTRQGDCFVVRKSFPLLENHGLWNLADLPDLSPLSVLPGLEEIARVPAERILFVDTETTGLSGGAGTYVFLIGAARYEGDILHFAQFFLQEPGSEGAQLSALETFAAATDLIVTYNGKSFDLPRIRTRYQFHGWQSPFLGIPHVDLLHISRRLWKDHLPGCSLGDLEHHILGVERSSLDIPGWQVAEKFYDYLQTGDPEPLLGVFYHNEVDVISLVSLLGYITRRIGNPLSPEYHASADLISIGNFLIQIQDPRQAISVLTQALSNPDLPERIRSAGLYSLADLYKRDQDYASALPLWQESAGFGDARSHIELAKYFEHKAADYQEAIHWTLSALELYRTGKMDSGAGLISKAEHRLARLKRKSAPDKTAGP